MNRKACVCNKELLKRPDFVQEDIFDELGNYAFCLDIIEDGTYTRERMALFRIAYLKEIERRSGTDFRFATAKTIMHSRLYENICAYSEIQSFNILQIPAKALRLLYCQFVSEF